MPTLADKILAAEQILEEDQKRAVGVQEYLTGDYLGTSPYNWQRTPLPYATQKIFGEYWEHPVIVQAQTGVSVEEQASRVIELRDDNIFPGEDYEQARAKMKPILGLLAGRFHSALLMGESWTALFLGHSEPLAHQQYTANQYLQRAASVDRAVQERPDIR